MPARPGLCLLQGRQLRKGNCLIAGSRSIRRSGTDGQSEIVECKKLKPFTPACDPVSSSLRMRLHEYKRFLWLTDMAQESRAQFAASGFATSERTGFNTDE